MTKDISKAVAYEMRSGEVYAGICEEIRDISKTDKEIKLKKAFLIPSENQFKNDKSFVKDLWGFIESTNSFSIKIKDIKSSYILD